MNSIASTLINMSAAGGIVIAVIIIARLIIRKAPKKFSYMLWIAAAFRLLCPVSIRSAFSLFRLLPSSSAVSESSGGMTGSLDYTSALVKMASERAAAPQVISSAVPQAVSSAIPQAVSSPVPQAAVSAAPGAAAVAEAAPTKMPVIGAATAHAAADPVNTLFTVLGIIWLIGFIALIAYGIVSYIKTKHKLDTATRFEGNVFCSERVISPFILGFIKPRIYIPYGLDGDSLGYVLAHERYHYRRRDYLINALAFLLLAVHWFDPLCWVAYFLMTRDMEMSCDEKVLACGTNISTEYSRTLLSFAVKKQFPQPTPLAFGESAVKGRIKNAMNFKKPQVLTTVLVSLVCVLVVAACAVNPAPSGQITDDQSTHSFSPIYTDSAVEIALGMPEAGERFYSSGNTHFFISDAGTLYGWGNNTNGELGFASNENYVSEPVKILENVHRLVVPTGSSLIDRYGAITTDGAFYTWGVKLVRESDLHVGDSDPVLAPYRVLDNVHDAFIPMARYDYLTADGVIHTFSSDLPRFAAYVLKQDGTVWGTLLTGDEPVQLYSGVTKMKVCGAEKVQLLMHDGSFWSLGGGYSLLGDGNMLTRTTPVKIMDGITDFGETYALAEDGTLYGWGSIFNTNDTSLPTKIADGVKRVISTDGYSCLFIKNDDSLWSFCKFSLTNRQYSAEPIHIADNIKSAVLFDWRERGFLTSPAPIDYAPAGIALTTSGELISWGFNHSGVLAKPDALAEEYSAPSVVATDVAMFATDGRSTFIVKNDGTLWACGYNGASANGWSELAQGRLGDGTRETRLEFVKIMDGVKSVHHIPVWVMVGTDVETGGEDWDMNYTHTFAVMNDGSVFTWGIVGAPYSLDWIYDSESEIVSNDSPVPVGAKFDQ